MGGRYQTIQVDFSGCSDASMDDLLARDEVDAFGLISAPDASFPDSLSLLSKAEFDTFPKPPRRSELPGVLGVLAEDPKEANAPEPSPNAEDAPFGVGDDKFVVLRGEIPLKGFGLALAGVSPPNRFADGYARVVSVLLRSLLLLLLLAVEVERESLLEVLVPQIVKRDNTRSLSHTWSGVAKGYCYPLMLIVTEILYGTRCDCKVAHSSECQLRAQRKGQRIRDKFTASCVSNRRFCAFVSLRKGRRISSSKTIDRVQQSQFLVMLRGCFWF